MTGQTKYENLQLDDNDDLSTTEVEESLMGDQKRLHLEEFEQWSKKSKRRTCLSILDASRWIFEGLLLFIITGLLLRDQSQNVYLKTSEHEVGGDLTGVGPHCEKFFRVNKKGFI
jgi:hypothetical protein